MTRAHTKQLSALGVVTLSAAIVAHLGLGTVWIPPTRVLEALLNRAQNPVDRQIVWELRLPRTLVGATVGAMLGTAGAALQALSHNRLADPALTGVSSGGVVAAVAFLTGAFGLPHPQGLLPFVVLAGCLCGGLGVYVLSSDHGSVDPARLALTGIVTNAILGSVTSILLLRDQQALGGVLPWLIGSLNGRVWDDVHLVIPWACGGLLMTLGLARQLNVIQLDHRLVPSLGIDLRRAQARLFASVAVLCAGAVSVSGAIGFVGLIVPNALRRRVGDDARRLLPLSALYGAALVVSADAIAQALTVKPPFPSSVQRAGVPVGAVLAVFGAAVLLASLHRQRSRTVTGLG